MVRAPVSTCALVCLGICILAVVECAARRLVCWQAIMNCQAEPECNYAYGQYMYACEPVLHGTRKTCPSHCIASLVQLNLTRSGPALEDCSCASDNRCLETKRFIEPCMPRTSSLGCTDARRQCDRDPQCRAAMSNYLHHCSKLFSGSLCTNACRKVIADMRKLPKAQLLDTCVCDGTERTICEYIKLKMKNLCFGEVIVDEDPDEGSADSDECDDEDYMPQPKMDKSTASVWGASVGLVVLVESILMLVQVLS